MLIVTNAYRWHVGEVFSTPENVISLKATGQELKLLQSLDSALGFSSENQLVGTWVRADAKRIAKEIHKISPNPALRVYEDAEMQKLCVQQTREMKNLFAEHAQERQKCCERMLGSK